MWRLGISIKVILRYYAIRKKQKKHYNSNNNNNVFFSYEMEGKEALHYVNMCVFVSGPGP